MTTMRRRKTDSQKEPTSLELIIDAVVAIAVMTQRRPLYDMVVGKSVDDWHWPTVISELQSIEQAKGTAAEDADVVLKELKWLRQPRWLQSLLG